MLSFLRLVSAGAGSLKWGRRSWLLLLSWWRGWRLRVVVVDSTLTGAVHPSCTELLLLDVNCSLALSWKWAAYLLFKIKGREVAGSDGGDPLPVVATIC